MWLRQNTETTENLGPFLSNDTGTLNITNLVITPDLIKIGKNGGTMLAKEQAGTAVYNTDGDYQFTFGTGDTDTLGKLRYSINVGTSLPVWGDYEVVTQNVYDSFFGTNKFDVGTAERVNSAPASNPSGGTVGLAIQVNTLPSTLGTVQNVLAVQDKTAYSLGTSNMQSLVDDIWDELLTGATHNIPTSAGRKVREIASDIILTGTTPGSNDRISIQLDGNASALDRTYDPSIIAIVNGTGVGQSRQIWEYNGTTKTAYINRNWAVIPSDDAEYIILSDSGDTHVNEGLVAGATGTSLTLNSLASDFDNAYINQYAFISAGTGADDNHRILSYNGTTKIAIIQGTWSEIPVANESIYAVLPSDNPTGGTIGLVTDITTKTGYSLSPDQSGVSIGSVGLAIQVNSGTTDYVKDAGTLLIGLSRDEPGQGTPSATSDIWTKLDHLYKAYRNKKLHNGTEWHLFNDIGDTVDQKSIDSDNGSTAITGEIITGP